MKRNEDRMEILIYENSSGFANYSYKICNELSIMTQKKISYMTDKINIYLDDIDNGVNVMPILKNPSNIKTKRFFWFVNRVYVGICNIFIRNSYIKKNKVDVLNIQSTLSIFEQFFIKKIVKKVKVILTVHDVIPPIRSFYWSKKSLKKLYKAVSLLIVHSEENRKQLIEQFGIEESKIKIIHHGTDTEYNRIDKDECLDYFNINKDNSKLFLFFGLIREQKGLDVLITSIEKLKEPCRILIAGSMPNGESFEKYERLITKPERYVKMIKFIEEEEIDYLFQAVDAVVFPYKYFYSQSGVFMQCIKYRKPIIATDVSSFRQYIEKYEIGLIAKPNDYISLKQVLEQFILMSEEEVTRIEKNIEQASYENSWKKAAELYIKCFE